LWPKSTGMRSWWSRARATPVMGLRSIRGTAPRIT
jgi:hypothetical protein